MDERKISASRLIAAIVLEARGSDSSFGGGPDGLSSLYALVDGRRVSRQDNRTVVNDMGLALGRFAETQMGQREISVERVMDRVLHIEVEGDLRVDRAVKVNSTSERFIETASSRTEDFLNRLRKNEDYEDVVRVYEGKEVGIAEVRENVLAQLPISSLKDVSRFFEEAKGVMLVASFNPQEGTIADPARLGRYVTKALEGDEKSHMRVFGTTNLVDAVAGLGDKVGAISGVTMRPGIGKQWDKLREGLDELRDLAGK